MGKKNLFLKWLKPKDKFKNVEIEKAEKISRPYEEGHRHLCRSNHENAGRPVFVHKDTV